MNKDGQFSNLYEQTPPDTVGAPASVAVEPLPTLLLGGGLGVVIVLLLALIVLVVRNKARAPISPKAQEALIEAEQQANTIVTEATNEARKVRADIERERLRALGEDKGEVERFIEAYSARLDRTIKDLTYGIEKEHMRATGHYVEALQKLERKVADEAEEAKHSMDSFTAQSGALFERLAAEIENVEKGIQHLAVALEEAAANESDKNADVVRAEMQKIGKQTAASVIEVAKGLDEALRKNLEREFAAVSKEVEKYRAARLELVDERILVLIEETAQIALGKSISMAEQSELVYRALEEAKQRGIFV